MKMKFHHCWLTPGTMRLAATWQNPLLPPPWKKYFRPPCMLLCVQIRAFQTFCTCPTIHQTHHFATPHLCWCNNTIIQISQCFSVFNWLNRFGAGAKSFWMLEPDLQPKKLDVWSWSQSLKFEFRIHSPAYAICSPPYTENAFAKINLILCFNISKVSQNFVQV